MRALHNATLDNAFPINPIIIDQIQYEKDGTDDKVKVNENEEEDMDVKNKVIGNDDDDAAANTHLMTMLSRMMWMTAMMSMTLMPKLI